MKHLKLFEQFNENDPFGEENWSYVHPDGTFLTWLKINYPDETSWDKLREIDCWNNQLTTLEGIEKLTSLERLYCSNNQLTTLEGIYNLTSLKELYCHNNQLTILEGIEKLTSLKYLICYNNQLTTLEGIEKLTSLRWLYCDNNQFSNNYKIYLKKLFITMNVIH